MTSQVSSMSEIAELKAKDEVVVLKGKYTGERATIHSVANATSACKFYRSLGLDTALHGDHAPRVGAAAGLCVELNEVVGGAYQPSGGYRGLSVRVPFVC